jgi:hypothetical protein
MERTRQETIGKAVKSAEGMEEGFEGVRFTFLYANENFDILLTHQELDTLLYLADKGFFQNVRNIELPEARLPLLVMVPEDTVVKDDSSAGWDVEMDVKIISSSHTHRHAGHMAVVGVKKDDGHHWSKILYEESPPLTHSLVRETKIAPIK